MTYINLIVICQTCWYRLITSYKNHHSYAAYHARSHANALRSILSCELTYSTAAILVANNMKHKLGIEECQHYRVFFSTFNMVINIVITAIMVILFCLLLLSLLLVSLLSLLLLSLLLLKNYTFEFTIDCLSGRCIWLMWVQSCLILKCQYAITDPWKPLYIDLLQHSKNIAFIIFF